jgi:formate hydrogenlyase subunit 3/multisubunit Na+/H+ antiporter MnhD subunit
MTWVMALLVISYYAAAFFVTIFQCTPVAKSWRPKESGTCSDLDKCRYYTAAANIITSVLIIVIPLPALSKMRHTRPEITELMGLILLGLM